MAKVLVMFPGQGSQAVGMADAVLAKSPGAIQLFAEAENASGMPLRRYCQEGPEDILKLTAVQQPCLVATSIALWDNLRAETGMVPDFFAGHSLGEYSALVAAGKLAFTDAIRLVQARGSFMQEAVGDSGAMAAVLGGDEADLVALCREISRPDAVVEIANYNSPQQLIISGHRNAVDAVAAELKSRRIKSLPLPVSAPFHSSLMAPARDRMEPLLQQTTLNHNGAQVIANVTGEIASPYSLQLLVDQIDRPVQWIKTLRTAVAAGVRTFVEIGPGAVLTGLARRTVGTEGMTFVTCGGDLNKAAASLREL